MVRQIALALSILFLWTVTNAQSISLQDLSGVWNYESYAEIESPDVKVPVGAQMDFRPDGIVVMTLSTGKAEGDYTIDGDTIHYSDSNGPQEWKVRSYEPGERLLLEHKRALMFFVRPREE